MPNLVGGKKHWYTQVIGIIWPQKEADPQPPAPRPDAPKVMVDDDAKASIVIDEVGRIDDKIVHLTIFRDTWRFRFRKDLPTDDIVDRIFGSGMGGMHVTLELSPTESLHCYRDGVNQGRTKAEQDALAAMLNNAFEQAKLRIDDAKAKHDAFEWTDCDDPAKRFEYLYSDVATDGFGRLARMVAEVCKAHVVYPPQADSALLWAGSAVHPLQMLQNTHQRQIRDACRGLGTDEARVRESDGMSRFFHFQASPPQPLGPADPKHKTIDERMADVESSLSTIGRFLDVAEIGKLEKVLGEAQKTLKSVRGTFFAVPTIHGEAPKDTAKRKETQMKRASAIPALAEMEKKMGRVHKALTTNKPPTREDCEVAHAQLVKAHSDLSDVLAGVCSIQNFHSIEPFYLFRLMVKFDLRSTSAIPPNMRARVSGGATGFLHNSGQMAWLFEWLRDRLVELDARLAKALPGKGPARGHWHGGEPKYCFYLKGGRAAKYAQDRGREGENDWDTNIIINPTLRAGEWYETFVIVHNTVLAFLQDAKRDFTMAMHDAGSCAKFLAALDEHQAALDKAAKEKADKEKAEKERAEEAERQRVAAQYMPERVVRSVFGFFYSAVASAGSAVVSFVDELVNDVDDGVDRQADLQADLAWRKPGIEIEEGEREGCKAELIDIGIPRRDTIEAFTQWFHVCPHVVEKGDKIKIPGHLYYVAEYGLMIREAFGNRSISVGKTPKRVMRLLEVLELGALDGMLDEHDEDPAVEDVLPTSWGKIIALDAPRKRMMRFLTMHLLIAYELKIDPGLATCFDTLYASSLDSPAAKAAYPKSLTDAIKAYEADEAKKPLADQVPYEAKHRDLADSIGYVQWVAEQMDKHFREQRAAYIEKHRNTLENLVRAIYTGSVFAEFEELQVKLAITGAYAAKLHAEYGRLERERFKELEPIRRLDITVYGRDHAKPEVVLELVQPLLQHYLDEGQGTATIKFTSLTVGGDTICLVLPVAEAFASDFTYKPLVVKITAVSSEENWPAVSFIRGLPVLNLRDLIWEYKVRAGHIEEAYTQEGLRIAVDALSDLLTRFENPSPGALPAATVVAPVQGGVPPQPPGQQPPVQVAQPVVPIVRKDVAITQIGQEKGNWCWAATSLMMRRFYLNDQSTLHEIVREAFGDLHDSMNALRLGRLKPEAPVERRTLTWPAIKGLIDGKKPFIIGNHGHYYVCHGYEEQGARKTLVVWDPLGQGKRSTIEYAAYEDGTKNQDWATACNFTITARRELIPITLSTAALDFNGADVDLVATIDGMLPKAHVTAATVHVRAARNVRGEVGAVLQRRDLLLPPGNVNLASVVKSLCSRLTADDGVDFLVELECVLSEAASAYRPRADGTQRPMRVTPRV